MKATKTVAQSRRVRKPGVLAPSTSIDPAPLHPSRNGVIMLAGFGLRINVERGHLILEDGIGNERRRGRFPRVYHGLKRVMVVGYDGHVSLSAIRWMADQKVSFSMLERTGGLLLSTGPVASSDARIRRAQGVSRDSPLALEIARDLIRRKLVEQEQALRHGVGNETAAEQVSHFRERLERLGSIDEIIWTEGQAASAYWTAWRAVKAGFPKQEAATVPEHWKTFGIRRSLLTFSPRKAVNPINAILNYLYVLLESETLIAIRAMGLDPGLGILHFDDAVRDSLVYDLMEPVRPKVDAFVLEWLARTPLRRSFFLEERDGNCRLVSELCQELADTVSIWAQEVAPIVEWFAASIWKTMHHTFGEWAPGTRLTQRRRREATGVVAPLAIKAPVMPTVCQHCSKAVSRRRKLCAECNQIELRKRWKAVQERKRGVAMTDEAKQKSSTRMKEHRTAIRNFDPSTLPWWLTEDFYRAQIQPALRQMSTRELAAAIGVNRAYISHVKNRGDIAHPRFWLKLAEVLGLMPDTQAFDDV